MKIIQIQIVIKRKKTITVIGKSVMNNEDVI